MAGDLWTFNVTPAVPNGSIVITDGTTSVDISPMTVMADTYSTDSFVSGTTVSMEFTHEDYPDVVFKPQTAVVGTTTNINFIPTMLYAWSSSNSGTFPSTIYTWSDDIINDDIMGFEFWANYQNGTADNITDSIINEGPSVVDATSFELTVDSDAVYTRDSSKDVVTITQTVANLSDGTNTYEIEDSQARADIQEIQSNYVTTDTAQTITGFKTISNDGLDDSSQMAVVCENIDLNNLPSATIYGGIIFQDVNGTRIGKVEPYIKSDGNVLIKLSVSRPVSGTMEYGTLALGMKTDGTVYTEAPASAVINSIATTTGINKATNGYVKLGNGIIIQWGDHSTTSAGASTITFPTAFTNNNYSIVVTRVSGTSTTNDSGSYYFRGRTTTSVGVYKTNNNTQAMMWIAVGY